jgi:hypothetical protein
MKACLSPAQVEHFREQGFLLIREFYDIPSEIEPVLHAIYGIIGILLEKYKVKINRLPFDYNTFDHGLKHLIEIDRSIGGVIYDAVKQIPAFQRIICCHANEKLFMQLRKTTLSGIASGGSGIRIDHPHESKFMAPWHQEYPAQLRSSDGLVFWSPLRPLTQELGPVEICPGSHKEGALKVLTFDETAPEKSGAYALRLFNESDILSRYEKIAPLSQPGDLLIMDWFVLHRSGINSSPDSRWTMQLRYFNFTEESGIKHNWKGSFAAGMDFGKLFPELVVKHKDSI